METEMEKIALTGCSNFISTIILGYTVAHGSMAIHNSHISLFFAFSPPSLKSSFESEGTKINRDGGGNVKVNRLELSFSLLDFSSSFSCTYAHFND